MIEVEEDQTFAMNLRFPTAQASGKVVLTATDISKKFGEKVVLNKQSIEILRGEKIAFLGKNGMGKTTFSRILVNDMPADSGSSELGYNVTAVSYTHLDVYKRQSRLWV